MATNKLFTTPFATGGDKTPAIPNAQQPNGSVSYTTGYGSDYELQLGVDPSAKNIGRGSFNSLFFDITTALREMQSGYGAQPFSATLAASLPGAGYPIGAVIPKAVGAGQRWVNTVANNANNPDTGGAGWISADSLISGRFIGCQRILASGTFTPSPGANNFIVEMVGGGGGSAHVVATGAGQFATTGGAGAGMYARLLLTLAQIGSSVACTIGAGGNGATAGGGSASTNGGSTSFGTFGTVSGGARSTAGIVSTGTYLTAPGAGGNTFSGSATPINVKPGESGSWGVYSVGSGQLGGNGGSSALGGGGYGVGIGSSANPGSLGSGGGASALGSSSASIAGANGGTGAILVWEFT